jgi:PAS domain S-box-containing protein
MGTPPSTFRTISLFRDGSFRDRIDYSLECTPCTELLRDETCAVLDNLRERYAENPFVHEWDINSYLGVALRKNDGSTVGLIAAVYREPVRDPDEAMKVLQLFALRAGAELERRRAYEQLHASEERFRLLAQTTSDALREWDLSTQAVWWSDGFEKLFGFTRSGIEPDVASWTNRLHPDDRERVLRSVQAAIDGPRDQWQDEYRFLRSDGRYSLVLDRGFIVRDSSGRALRMIGGMTDMTERLETDQRMREQAELLDRASDGIYVRGLDHRVRYWNRGAERIYGWAPAQAVGRDVRELLREEAVDFASANTIVLSRGEWSGEIHHRDSHNKEITVHARWTLLRDPSGEPHAILAIDTDVTEKKRIEAQFLRAQRLESIGILAGGIAHDLNNMLTPITMAVDMLKRVHRDDDSTPLVDAIENSARRGADLVRQVMSFTRGVEGRKLDVNPNFLVRDIATIARETFPKNIRIITELPTEPWLVRSDPTQLHQILLNLCINARDALPAGGEIVISVQNTQLDEHFAGMDAKAAPGNYVLILVRDTGTGIPEEVRDKIFDPFFTTKEPGKGTGLGLATVLGIVKSHGGWVDFSSEVGHGTTFRVYLPAAAGSAQLAAERAEANLPRGHGECVLVVDDEAAIRTISKQTLEAFGYTVLVASDGAEGLAVYVQNMGRVALVLTDMMMPIMDGPALIRALLRVDPSARIVAASGLNAEGMVARAADAGVTNFLPKPYTAETMLKKIDAILHRPAAPD